MRRMPLLPEFYPMNTIARPLGGYEKAFWIVDQICRTHFAMAVEVCGRIGEEEFQTALDAVQARHPLLSVSIEGDRYKNPAFRFVPGKKISVRIMNGPAVDRLEKEIATELSVPFDWTQGTLIRAVLIKDEVDSAVILTAHHAICDGMSMTYIFRDLLLALTDKKIEPLPLPLATDDLIDLPDRKLTNSLDLGQGTENGSIFQRRQESLPQISRLKLSKDLTGRLAERARMEGTTVHGAIYAALVIAVRKIAVEWKDKPIRILSPVSIRKELGVGDDCGLYLTSKIVAAEPANDVGFWDHSRYAISELAEVKKREIIVAGIRLMHENLFRDVSPNELAQALRNRIDGRDMIITNLGKLPYEPDFGRLKITSMWGPIVLSGIKNEQTIGAVTVNGSLCLSLVSRNPLARLLDKMAIELADACL